MKFFPVIFRTLPFLSVLSFIIVGANLTLELHPFLPSFFLIPVYYWLIFRPDWLPLWSLMIIGVFYDSLLGYSLGFSSFFLLLGGISLYYLRSLLDPENFLLSWLAFGLYSFVYTLLYGLFLSSGGALFVTWVLAFGLYPFGAWGLIHLHTWLQAHA